MFFLDVSGQKNVLYNLAYRNGPMKIYHFRCAEVSTKLKQCQEQLYQISDLLPQIDLPEDGAPITMEWMKGRQEEIASERTRLFNEKRSDNNKLTKYKEMVLSELEKLRGLNRAHRKLMVEVWQHLTALARVSGHGMGQGQ